MNSFVPDPIAMSTCEAESNAQCIAIMASRHINKMVMEILTGHPDTPFTLPLFTDNKSSINLAESDKRTKASRHIERRFQYVRHAVIRGLTALYFVADITHQLADIVTKSLSAHESSSKLEIIEADLPNEPRSATEEGC